MSAYTAIASQTLGSSASSVTFSSIPGTFRDLVIVLRFTASDGNIFPAMTFNSDTGANYNLVRMDGNGSSADSGTASGNSQFNIFGGFATSGRNFMATYNVMDYSQTNKHKSMLGREDDAAGSVSARAYRWASTAAITTITFGGTYPAGSTFSLYGVSA